MSVTTISLKPTQNLNLLLSRERKYTNGDKPIETQTITMEWSRTGMEKVATKIINDDEWRNFIVEGFDLSSALDSLEKDDQQTILIAKKVTDEYTDILIIHPAAYKSSSGWTYGLFSLKPLSEDMD